MITTLNTLFNELETVLLAIGDFDYGGVNELPIDEGRLYRAALIVRQEALQEAINAVYEVMQ